MRSSKKCDFYDKEDHSYDGKDDGPNGAPCRGSGGAQSPAHALPVELQTVGERSVSLDAEQGRYDGRQADSLREQLPDAVNGVQFICDAFVQVEQEWLQNMWPTNEIFSFPVCIFTITTGKPAKAEAVLDVKQETKDQRAHGPRFDTK